MKSDEYNGTDVHDKHIIRSALSIQLLTVDYLHSMKTSEPRGSADPSIRNPNPSWLKGHTVRQPRTHPSSGDHLLPKS
ncbi:rhodanese-like domain-containing protein 9, chloroplastic [Dorcoceras hygrometricum]|uniref:Rhodanese-like domain-containing protein 9, chloroplastic n=1 Tax=Dorcoceras hygrometricum TaxID=472368 RepID=A0A2Z7DGD9_9LAMI|nr:rhodanese-like domain-containing protein 9, chloroplastic [Dorcoceras hygrometricum]